MGESLHECRAQLVPGEFPQRLEVLAGRPKRGQGWPQKVVQVHNHSIVDSRYRYTRYAEGSEELYDRQKDPHEFDNLIAQAKTDEALQGVVKKLSAWIPKDEAGKPDLVDDRIKR